MKTKEQLKCELDEAKREIERISKEYKELKDGVTMLEGITDCIKEDSNRVMVSYLEIRDEYYEMKKEFMELLELVELDPDACILVMKEYRKELLEDKQEKEEEHDGQNDNTKFRVIVGGKK